MAKPAPKKGFENRMLAALQPEEYERLKGSLRALHLQRRAVLAEPEASVATVYFPRTAVASLVASMEDGSTIEIATVGNEGFVGLPVFLDTNTMPVEAFIQIEGDVAAVRASVLRDAAKSGGLLRSLIQRYTQALLLQIARAGACNRLHPIDQRVLSGDSGRVRASHRVSRFSGGVFSTAGATDPPQ